MLQDVNFNEEPLGDVAELLSGISRVNINVDPHLRSRITFNIVQKTTLRPFLESLADLYGFHIDHRSDGVFLRAGKEEKPEQYQIGSEDLSKFGFNSVLQLGRGIGTLISATDGTGRMRLALTDNYSCELTYQDYRDPYLIVQGKLIETGSEKTLIENSLFLEPDKPTLLGLTNLREALIFVVKLRAE